MKNRYINLSSTIIMLMILFSNIITAGGTPNQQPDDLTELSIEQLADLEVTSVAKKPQKISLSAAAVYVITNEDIQRSGATCIPEALRMVPGLEVAKINTGNWAVSARGFNGTYANKLLVMIDGRSIYSPVFSGIFWLIEDVLLEDVERIEVIRGPGASLWGANAVNGVINIITKHSRDTEGGFISTGFGTEERAFLNTRYGGEYNDSKNTYRLYAKGMIRDESVDLNDNPSGDDFSKIQTGFRTDQRLSDSNSITLQGDVYKTEDNVLASLADPTPPIYRSIHSEDIIYTGGNILGRWIHKSATGSDYSLQIYYDNLSCSSYGLSFNTHTVDMDFQNRFKASHRQEVIWGANYRFYTDDTDSTEPSDYISLIPEKKTLHLFSLFLMDEITIIEDQVFFTFGSKIEHHDYTGLEYLPNARLLWLYNDKHTFWAAISRATRCPSRGEHDVSAELKIIPPSTSMNPSPYPVEVTYKGNPDITSEILLAYELGYRIQTDSHIAFDMAVFYNQYEDNIYPSASETHFDTTTSYLVIPLIFDNRLKGNTRGCEFSVVWKPLQDIRLQTNYTYFDMNLETVNIDIMENLPNINTNSPSHQFSFNAGINLPWHIEGDLWFRYVDDILDGLIESYSTMDAHLAWKPTPSLTFTIVGKDLLEQRHVEFMEETGRMGITQVEHSVYTGIKWIF